MSIMPFEDAARLPVPNDNIAIATRFLPAGTEIQMDAKIIRLSHDLLLGHRFAVRPIAKGEFLSSWEQTFGIATKDIAIGDYVCNADVLNELRRRSLEVNLPDEANFENDLEHYQFDEAKFQPVPALERYSEMRYFSGYLRESGRGVGTRNTIILLATSSLCSGFVRKLESRLKDQLTDYPNIDGIVAIAHTEGAHGKSNNEGLVLRTLAGFVVNPNVAAVLFVDYGQDSLNNGLLQSYMQQNNYPIDTLPHDYLSLSASFEEDLLKAEAIVKQWLKPVNALTRSPQPISALKIALQCGGSDAFSGISANPLGAWVSKEIIRYGGSANLAETDELIGAETYILDKVRDVATVKKFLSFLDRFKERVAWHGHSAEGNPSGGNKYRGLYNIYLKSLGAATKRHPDVRLDYVIDYSERMQDSGYYFMDSPGNDLESVAGQMAAGCNIIFFMTGNGSITNFPFVPTIKVVTTTERYQLLSEEMDINAGEYLDGKSMDDLGAEMLDYTINIASGQLSVGEKAGHSQVQIWRDWQQTKLIPLDSIRVQQASGKPIEIQLGMDVPDVSYPVFRNGKILTSQLMGLILPTSLCSGQIARMTVEMLNQYPRESHEKLSKFVTLVHTEGCGGSVNNEFRDTLLGYLAHPFVKHALLLEHGCEATHNDYFRQALATRGYQAKDYGWASIQMDGGIQKVIQKMYHWFEDQIANSPAIEKTRAGLEALRIAVISNGQTSRNSSEALASLTKMIVAAGGTVVMPENDALLNADFAKQLGLTNNPFPSLNYAQTLPAAGFHVMEMPTRDWGEILTGLGAAGVELILSASENQAKPGHPMIPVFQIGDMSLGEFDMDEQSITIESLLDIVIDTLAQTYTPKVLQTGNVNFQITRGLLGVSL